MDGSGPLRVELLGDVRIVTPSKVVDGAVLAAHRSRVALAYLALERHREVDRHELADAVWPVKLPPTWPSALRTVLTQVREALGASGLGRESLRAKQGRLRLVLPPGSTTDVDATLGLVELAEQLVDEGDMTSAAAAAAEAIERVRTRPFLVGAEGAFVDAVRHRLGAAAHRAAGIACDALVASKRSSAAIAVAEDAVAAEPLDEEAHRRLMRVYAAAGDRARALRAYARCRVVLAEELGVDPSPDTERLYLELLQWDRGPVLTSSPLSTPAVPFAGRGEELELLRRWWCTVDAGAGGVALITGEAGVGKTRLAAEVAAEVERGGAIVLRGRCDEHATVAFQPFVEAARAWSETRGSLAEWLTGLADVATPDRADERTGVFDALVSWLCALATDQPVLLVVDDLHWASPSTLAAADRVLAGVRDHRVGVVMTCRTPSPRASEPLAARIGELARAQRVARVPLTGLDRASIDALVRHLVDAPTTVGEDLVDALASATGGNAFFLCEATRHLVDSGALQLDAGTRQVVPSISDAAVSPAIRDVVTARLSTLQGGHRGVLVTAALLGPVFDADTLVDCAGSEAVEALDNAEGLGLLVPEPGGGPLRYRFVHDLLRSVLVDGLSAVRRATLHRAVGSCLELRDAPAAQLARHFAEAARLGDTGPAVLWSLAAARVAVAELAYEDAQVPLRRVLELHLDDGARAEVLVALAEAQGRAGEVAEPTWADAIGCARRAGEGTILARAALGRVASTTPERSAWFGLAERRTELAEALAALPTDEVALQVRVLGELALVTPWHDDRHDLGRQAMAIAAADGGPQAIAAARRANLVAHWAPQDTRARLAFAEGALASGQLDRHEHAEVGFQVLSDLLQLGRRRECDARLAALETDEAVRSSRRLHWQSRVWRATLAIADGRLVEAERLGVDARELWPEGDGDALVSWGMQLAVIRVLQGRAEEAVALLGEGRRRYPDVGGFACGLAFACAEAGDTQGATAALESTAAGDFAGIPRDSSFAVSAACLAEAIRHVGDARRAARLYELLAPHAGLLVVLGGPGLYWGAIDHLLGLLAETIGDLTTAAGHYRDAAAMAAAADSPPWVARAQVALATLPADVVTAAERRRLADAARSTARALGLGSVERACAALVSAGGTGPRSSTRRASRR